RESAEPRSAPTDRLPAFGPAAPVADHQSLDASPTNPLVPRRRWLALPLWSGQRSGSRDNQETQPGYQAVQRSVGRGIASDSPANRRDNKRVPDWRSMPRKVPTGTSRRVDIPAACTRNRDPTLLRPLTPLIP